MHNEKRMTDFVFPLLCVLSMQMIACTITPGEGNPKRTSLAANDTDKGTAFQGFYYVKPIEKEKPPTESDTKDKELLNSKVTEEEKAKLAGACRDIELTSKMQVDFKDLDWPWLIEKLDETIATQQNLTCVNLGEEKPAKFKNDPEMTPDQMKTLSATVFKNSDKKTDPTMTMLDFIKDYVDTTYSDLSFCVVDPSTGKIQGTITDNQPTLGDTNAPKIAIDEASSRLRIVDGKEILSISYKIPGANPDAFPPFLASIEHQIETDDGVSELIHPDRPYEKMVMLTGEIKDQATFEGNLEFKAVTQSKPRDPVNCFFVCGGRVAGKTTGDVTPRTKTSSIPPAGNTSIAQISAPPPRNTNKSPEVLASNEMLQPEAAQLAPQPPVPEEKLPQDPALVQAPQIVDKPEELLTTPLRGSIDLASTYPAIEASDKEPDALDSAETFGVLNNLPNPTEVPIYRASRNSDTGDTKYYTHKEIDALCNQDPSAIKINTSLSLKLTLPKEYDPEDDVKDTSTLRGKIFQRVHDLTEWPFKVAAGNRVIRKMDALYEKPQNQELELKGCYTDQHSHLFVYNKIKPNISENNKRWFAYSPDHSVIALRSKKIVFRVLFPKVLLAEELDTLLGNLADTIKIRPKSNTQLIGTLAVNDKTATQFSTIPQAVKITPYEKISIGKRPNIRDDGRTRIIEKDWDIVTGKEFNANDPREVYMAIPAYSEMRVLEDFDVLKLPIEFING